MKVSIILDKSKHFAVRIVKLYKYLNDKGEYIIAKQLLRSGTSIGANVAEAECSVSKSDFIAKMHIAFKECYETAYWLDLLFETEYLTKSEYESIKKDSQELQRLLSAITKSAREKQETGK